MAKVQFKFRAAMSADRRRDVLTYLHRELAGTARQLFPTDEDDEMASLYIAEVADEACVARMLQYLRSCDAVEFAEPEVKRRLIR